MMMFSVVSFLLVLRFIAIGVVVSDWCVSRGMLGALGSICVFRVFMFQTVTQMRPRVRVYGDSLLVLSLLNLCSGISVFVCYSSCFVAVYLRVSLSLSLLS